MTFLIFVLILSILIVVHEGGHFLMARRLGVKVEQFALGFGPKLWSVTRGDTEYCCCAIPLGGYVKMAGEERAQCQGRPEEYFAKSPGQRSLIVLMGPVVNYVLAYLCFVVVFMIGYIDLDATNTALPPRVGEVMSGSPAAKAGLLAGDRVLAVNKVETPNWAVMQTNIAGAGAVPLSVTVERQGQKLVLTMVPEQSETKDIFGKKHPVSRIGIKPPPLSSGEQLVVRHYGFAASFGKAGQELISITTRTYGALWEIVTGQRSAKEGMTGLVGIFFIIKFAAGVGFSFLLHVVGVISASLAIFNLLPLVPLDGGHLAYIGLEKVRGRPLSPKTEDFIAKVGFALIIALAVFVFYVDFDRIGLIDRILGIFHKG